MGHIADLRTKALDKWTIWRHMEKLGYRRLRDGKTECIPEPKKRQSNKSCWGREISSTV